MTILQITPVVEKSFIDEWGAYGGILILLLFAIGFLVIYIKSRNKDERENLIEEKTNANDKNTILYTEIKEMQKVHSENQTDLLLKSQEIQSKTVEALNKTTDALNNNSMIFGKLIEKL